ncbi:MAG: NeuD/PglB/VioB family sugar acetyltransferase [Lentimicrobiaceae bacterium]|nr:NeuD/PglB/VioB family sugar acetyltransferase [Lentimicrobiaceae bacterium]
MKNLIIIGAGNFAKIVYEYALLSPDYNSKWNIKGFLDPNIDSMKNELNYPNVISTVDDYQVQKDDLFICSFVNPVDRVKSIETISGKGGKFISLIHFTANINRTSVLGEGAFIGAFTTLSVNTQIGNHVIIQDHCNIGHDSSVGDYSHLYVGNIICGKNEVGNQVSIFTGSTIYPKIKIGDNSTVGAGSVVMRSVKKDMTVIGNPAKILE